MILKSIAAALVQRDVLATIGISAGTLAFVRAINLEAAAQAAILGATAVFVVIRAALEARKLVMTVRADNAARRAKSRINRSRRQRNRRKEAREKISR
jgi:hypothetical protein